MDVDIYLFIHSFINMAGLVLHRGMESIVIHNDRFVVWTKLVCKQVVIVYKGFLWAIKPLLLLTPPVSPKCLSIPLPLPGNCFNVQYIYKVLSLWLNSRYHCFAIGLCQCSPEYNSNMLNITPPLFMYEDNRVSPLCKPLTLLYIRPTFRMSWFSVWPSAGKVTNLLFEHAWDNKAELLLGGWSYGSPMITVSLYMFPSPSVRQYVVDAGLTQRRKC